MKLGNCMGSSGQCFLAPSIQSFAIASSFRLLRFVGSPILACSHVYEALQNVYSLFFTTMFFKFNCAFPLSLNMCIDLDEKIMFETLFLKSETYCSRT